MTITDIEFGCNGSYTAKAATHNLLGPASMAADLPSFSAGPADQKFLLQHNILSGTTQAVPNAPYEIDLTDGSTLKGISDAEGKTELLARDALRIADVRIDKKKKTP